MQEGKTIGQLMEEMRQKAGAQNYHGHDYMDLQRFAENTRHMIIFDVLTHDSPVGWKGERTRLFLTETGLSLIHIFRRYPRGLVVIQHCRNRLIDVIIVIL